MKPRRSGSPWTRLSASNSDLMPALELHSAVASPIANVVPSDWRGVQPEAEHAAALALKQASYKKRIGGSKFSQDFQLSFS